MKELENLEKTIRLYKFTLVILSAVIVLTTIAYATVLLYIVPLVVSRSVAATSDARRAALLQQISDTVVSTLNQYDIHPN